MTYDKSLFTALIPFSKDKGKCVYDKFIEWANDVKTNAALKQAITSFSDCLKRYIQEEKYEYATAMLILFSFLNSDAFYLNPESVKLIFVKPIINDVNMV